MIRPSLTQSKNDVTYSFFDLTGVAINCAHKLREVWRRFAPHRENRPFRGAVTMHVGVT